MFSLSSIYSKKEKIPICKICHKSFANYSNLRHHIKIIHLKENKWKCNKCEKICSSKSNLKVHFRTHIRVKPYTCKYCNYICMHHSSIKDHLIKNHPDKPHTTIESGYFYNSQSVPEPNEFNSMNFNREKFLQSYHQQQQQQQIANISLIPIWPFNLYYPSIFHRKSFEIDEILDLSLPKKNQKTFSTNDNTI